MERNRYAVRVVSQQGDVETGIGDENKNALEIYIYIYIYLYFAEGNSYSYFEDRQRKGERGGFLKRIRVYIYISGLFHESRDELTSYRFPRYTIQQKTRLYESSSLAGAPIFSCFESVPFPARNGTLRPNPGGGRADHVEKIGWTDFDRPIDSYAEIRKCLHASGGYNYFAPKSHEVRAMTRKHCRGRRHRSIASIE